MICRRRSAPKPLRSKAGPRQRTFPSAGGDAYLAVSQGRLDNQMAALDALDTKAGAVTASALAEAAYVLALLALRPENSELSGWQVTGLVFAALLLVSTCAMGLLGLVVRDWQSYPDPGRTWDLRDRPQLDWELAMVLDDAFDANSDRQAAKACHVKWSAILLTVQTVVVVGTTVSVVWP